MKAYLQKKMGWAKGIGRLQFRLEDNLGTFTMEVKCTLAEYSMRDREDEITISDAKMFGRVIDVACLPN